MADKPAAVETIAPESADDLLNRILKGAVDSSKSKGEGAKDEDVKDEVKAEIKNEKVKAEKIKNEIKSEKIKGEVGVKSELPALPAPGETGAIRKRSRSRKKRSRSKKKKSRSRRRRRRRRDSSSSSSRSKSPVGEAIAGLPQARVVAVRGHWAQYLSPAGETFFKNVLNGEVQWQKPGNFDCVPSRRAGEMTPGPGEAACYIFHMPPEWTESDLMQLFAPFGQVTSAHVQRDANGFSRSCGFVTYATPDNANQACQMMNGFGIDGKFLKVSLTQFSMSASGQPTGPDSTPAPAPNPTPMGALGGLGGI